MKNTTSCGQSSSRVLHFLRRERRQKQAKETGGARAVEIKLRVCGVLENQDKRISGERE